MALAYDSTSYLATPVGTVITVPTTGVPTGYLLCDGSQLSATTYATLFNVLGTTHGTAGAGVFNIPDYRGRFLRGYDNATGRDLGAGSRFAMNAGGNAGDAIGTLQGQSTAKNGLALTDPGHTHAMLSNNAGTSGAATGWSGNSLNAFGSANINSSTTGVTLAGDPETRPLNANVNLMIRVF